MRDSNFFHSSFTRHCFAVRHSFLVINFWGSKILILLGTVLGSKTLIFLVTVFHPYSIFIRQCFLFKILTRHCFVIKIPLSLVAGSYLSLFLGLDFDNFSFCSLLTQILSSQVWSSCPLGTTLLVSRAAPFGTYTTRQLLCILSTLT